MFFNNFDLTRENGLKVDIDNEEIGKEKISYGRPKESNARPIFDFVGD